MSCIRQLCKAALVATVVALAGVPAKAEAQSTNMGSSMSGACLVADCSQVRFVLDFQSTVFVKIVSIFSHDPAQWQFASLLGVTDNNGTVLPWAGAVSTNQLLLSTSGLPFGQAPIFLTVAMATASTPGNLHNGSLTYSGQGNTQADGLGTDISYGGTVTPEPASMLLLGTGLAGVVGAARRRRAGAKVEKEVA